MLLLAFERRGGLAWVFTDPYCLSSSEYPSKSSDDDEELILIVLSVTVSSTKSPSEAKSCLYDVMGNGHALFNLAHNNYYYRNFFFPSAKVNRCQAKQPGLRLCTCTPVK